MTQPEDFKRLGSLLGDVCEVAAGEAPAETEGGRGPKGRGAARLVPGGGAREARKPESARQDNGRLLASVWPQVVGDEIAANACPVHFRGGRLVVSTSSSVWADTLQYMGEELKARINDSLGADEVERIVFRHAGWEDRPRPNGPGQVAGADRPGGPGGRATLSETEREALAEVERLDLPEDIREQIAAAMRASFVRAQQDSVR